MESGMNLDMSQRQARQLSADAKTYVPRNVRMDKTSIFDQPAPRTEPRTEMQQLPLYATTCYPFMLADGGHARHRLSANWQGPGRPQHSYDPNNSTGLKDNHYVPSLKMPYAEFNGYSQPLVFTPYQSSHQEVQDNQTHGQPHIAPYSLSTCDFQYTGPFPLSAAQCDSNLWMVASDDLSSQSIPSLLGSGSTVALVHAAPVYPRLPMRNKGQKKIGLNSNQVSVGIQYETLADREADLKEKAVTCRRTIICKDCATQTAFSSDFANKNLQALPSPFYDESSKNWLSGENFTDSEELESDSGYCVSPWRRQIQMAGSANADDASLFVPSVHSSLYTQNSQPWLGNETPLSCLYVPSVSSYGTTPEALMYQTLEDPSMNLIPYDPRFNVGHTTSRKYSTALSNGVCWSQVAHSRTNRGPIFEAEWTRPQNRRGRRRQTKGISLNTSQDASASPCQAVSVGNIAILGGLTDIEEEFPNLLIAAGGFPSPCDSIEVTAAATDENKLAYPQPEYFEHFKWTDSSSCIFTMKKSSVASAREGPGKSANKKKQKRQEQLSRAADEELAEISLEQQVLREISSGHRHLLPSFRPAVDILSATSSVVQNPTFILGGTESLESGELSAHSVQPEMVICKEEEEKLRGNSGIVLEMLPSLNHLKMAFGDENIPLNIIDLSQSTTSSKTSSIGATGDRGTSGSTDLSPISQTSPLSMSSPVSSPFGSGITSPRNGLADVNKFAVISQIHSPRFREYCNQVLSREIDNCCTELLQRLIRSQDRYYQFDRDNRTNSVKRRTVLGLREVTKHLKMSHLCCVIISPNMDITQSKGGLEEALRVIIELCEERKVLFVFALGRHALGRACAKLVPVSVVGIFSCDGAEEHFHQLQKLTRQARSAYQEMVATLLRSKGTNSVQTTLSLNAGHSRTPSGCSIMSVTSSVLSESISEDDPKRDSTSETILVEEEKSAEANRFLRRDYIKNGKDGVNNHSNESAPTSNESSDGEEVVVDEKVSYEVNSVDELLILQSLDTQNNEATCYTFTPNSGKGTFKKSATENDSEHCTEILVMDLLQNSSKDSISQGNGHLTEGSDTDIVKTNTLAVEKLNECSWYQTKEKYNHSKSWMPATELTKEPICIELLTQSFL